MNFETLEKLPTSMGTNVTSIPNFLKEDSAKSETIVTPEGTLKNTVPLDEAIKTADHTKISPLVFDNNGVQQPIQTANNNAALGSMLESKLAIELIDAVLPGILVAALYSIQIKLTKKDLQLTEKEKTTI